MIVDTHVLLWWAEGSAKLSKAARRAIASGEIRLLWSVASSWEVAIKVSTGRLSLPVSLQEFVELVVPAQGLEPLGITTSHLVRVAALPFVHRDPFDRMLVAQAQVEGVPILSADPALHGYDVEVVW